MFLSTISEERAGEITHILKMCAMNLNSGLHLQQHVGGGIWGGYIRKMYVKCSGNMEL
jgi:hypothetical protein